MNLNERPELKRQLASLTAGLLLYLDGEEAPYTEEEVDRCKDILLGYLSIIDEATDRESALEIVKSAVLQLNSLNESCGHRLIETSQRDDICGFITTALEIKGFGKANEEVRWRNW